MTLQCKICGVSDIATLSFIINYQFPPRFVGFIVKYPKSKRFVKIEKLKEGAPEKINKIAIETSSELVKKLIGAEVNNSSISAIVDDSSKRNGDKYYGN